MNINKDYEFTIKGKFDDEIMRITYNYHDGKGSYNGDQVIELLLNDALNSIDPIGPVGQHMDRDINNPLVVLFILKDEVFDEIIEVVGEIPMANILPNDSI